MDGAATQVPLEAKVALLNEEDRLMSQTDEYVFCGKGLSLLCFVLIRALQLIKCDTELCTFA